MHHSWCWCCFSLQKLPQLQYQCRAINDTHNNNDNTLPTFFSSSSTFSQQKLQQRGNQQFPLCRLCNWNCLNKCSNHRRAHSTRPWPRWRVTTPARWPHLLVLLLEQPPPLQWWPDHHHPHHHHHPLSTVVITPTTISTITLLNCRAGNSIILLDRWPEEVEQVVVAVDQANC